MNILFVASVFRHLTSFHIPYIKYLQSKGHKVCAAGAGQGDKEILEELGIQCIDITFSRSPINIQNLNAYKELKHLFRKNDFNLVHVHTPIAALLTRMAYHFAKKGKIIYTAHGYHFYKGAPLLNWLVYYPLERLAVRWTDYLITINEEDYKRALKLGYKQDTVHYVHGVGVEPSGNCIGIAEKTAMKRQMGIHEDAVVISYVAEINKNKNHEFLLRNWMKIKDRSPNATLLIIGDGVHRLEIERFIQEKELEDVHLLGFRTDVNKILGITDVATLLSHREGLPKSIMEAMSSSVPCVVTDTRGLRDLVTNGESGYVVPHTNDNVLVESFISLLNDNEKRHEMGNAALRNVDPYRLENVLEEYKAIYEEALRKE